MKKIALFALVALAVYSCKTEKIAIKNSSNLIGTWSMVSYSGGFAGGRYAPASPTALEFTADSIFKKYLNNQLTTQGSYHITVYSSPNDVPRRDSVIYFQNQSITQAYVFKSRDTLFLNDFNIADGFSYKYVRVK